ncbi:hypothetical protein [Streptomyces sp. NBC_00859]|uniref:hypothetical protein n=1 Tax=Streptomyces sp. NBC_00859 TaxID=2903682 RepID=UPI00386FC2F8|nr:hypothetical protein OG584_01015 [Streptomyces sp. NBC_00859]
MSSEQDSGTRRDTGYDTPPPNDEQRAGWHSVQQRAKGLTHHQAKAALEAARRTADEDRRPGQEQDRTRAGAEIEEWERIVESLADHDGRYDPDVDPFVQGELAGHSDRAPDQPSLPRPAAPGAV